MRRVIYTGLVLSAAVLFAAGLLHGDPRADLTQGVVQVAAQGAATQGAAQAVAFAETTPDPPSRAEQVARALVQAYPGRVERAEFRGGDWAVLLRGIWFHYAEGRLMPEEFLYRAENYSPLAFYNNYPAHMPEWISPSEEQLARFQGAARGGGQARQRRQRAPYFFDTLYQATSRETARAQMVQARFLGFRVNVHRSIEGQLALVERTILAAARSDRTVQRWIDETESVSGWNWRNVGGTQTRSFHAYGIAIDILPRDNALAGREMFWAWASGRRADWWNIPFEGRYHPPAAVIEAFELHGFVWGGKWTHFDTMHFEFRPEVMILRGMPLVLAQP